MITKINSVKNVAVFKNFDWNSSVIKMGNVVDLKKINILFGRNYAGKTSLSRIFRAMETKSLTAYANPEFSLQFEDGSSRTQDNYKVSEDVVRVFNEDFIKENLAFISNPLENIKPFAILGENTSINLEIQKIKKELGCKDLEKGLSGLYKELDEAKNNASEVKKKKENFGSDLEKKLKDKASVDKKRSIKYQEKFGEINYNIQKLKNDLSIVKDNEEYGLTPEEIKEIEILLQEKQKAKIAKFVFDLPNFLNLETEIKDLVERPLVQTEKIEELVKNALLNNWVKEGLSLHDGKKICAFCGNEISQSRWHELECHFDEATKKLDSDISERISSLSAEKNRFFVIEFYQGSQFYGNNQEAYSSLNQKFIDIKKQILDYYAELIEILSLRKKDLLNPLKFQINNRISKNEVDVFVEKVNELVDEFNKTTENLLTQQKKGRERLRLNEVRVFSVEIDYNKKLEMQKQFETDYLDLLQNCEKIETVVLQKERLVEELEAKLNDESLGAEKVNEYLNNFFGNEYLHLKAIKESPDAIATRFEIQRNGSLAKNMSEGECRLLAFCYFMAKLEDVKTKGTKPIIWIDDPICSLDSNHVFFVYSLINAEIVKKDSFEQLFVSTHNLDFLKYLKRLKDEKYDTKEEKRKTRYLMIERTNDSSDLKIMPRYMVEYVSEFNYLFECIYRCSLINAIDDTNYSLFYNFGNNARKFLELYLYYKYPGQLDEKKRFESFFGDSLTISVLNRLNNEYSHMCGVFERGERIVDVPEILKVAKTITERIKIKDPEQYQSLVNGISV